MARAGGSRFSVSAPEALCCRALSRLRQLWPFRPTNYASNVNLLWLRFDQKCRGRRLSEGSHRMEQATPRAIVGLVHELVEDFTRRRGRRPQAIVLQEAERAALLIALGMNARDLLHPEKPFDYQGIPVLNADLCVRLGGVCAWRGRTGQGCTDTATTSDGLCRRHRSIVELAQEPPRRLEFGA